MKNKNKAEEKELQKCPVTGKEVKEQADDSESEEEKPQGGCPFMGGGSDKKKNPNLKLT